LAGCGGAGRAGDRIRGTTLTIYSSGPMHGASSVSARAVLSGERLALAQAQGRIGNYRLVLKSLDDSTAQRDEWDPGQTTVDAHEAVSDRTTIGYLGDLDSGASAISIPVLNRMGIPQISPASTAVGLTSGGPGASPGEPQKYYPTGVRSYVRIVPNDAVQAVVQVKLQRSLGCARTYVVDDGEFDGQAFAATFALAAQAARLAVAGVQAFDPRASDYSSLAASIAQLAPDCVLLSAITENHAVLVSRQLAAALPSATIFASAGMAESTYTDPAQGGIPIELDPRVLITVATLRPSVYPPAGRAFFAAYDREYGPPQPYAIYGYEAMRLLLTAISRATHGGTRPAQRSKVLAALFATRSRHSAVGVYSIDGNGDTTQRSYGVYRVVDGHLEYWHAVDG
jgi:branched-chain amino acid transport system substrate-binding protein